MKFAMTILLALFFFKIQAQSSFTMQSELSISSQSSVYNSGNLIDDNQNTITTFQPNGYIIIDIPYGLPRIHKVAGVGSFENNDFQVVVLRRKSSDWFYKGPINPETGLVLDDNYQSIRIVNSSGSFHGLKEFEVYFGYPDFVITKHSSQGIGWMGTVGPVSFTITNEGAVSSESGSVLVSLKHPLVFEPYIFKIIDTGFIEAGSSVTESFNVRFPVFTKEGNGKFRIEADYDKKIHESNEQNNLSSRFCAIRFPSDSRMSENLHLDENHDFNINIYPNPASNQVTLNLNSKDSHRIRITDLSGATIYRDLVSQGGTEKIDVSDFEPGMYLVKVKGSIFDQVEKLIIR